MKRSNRLLFGSIKSLWAVLFSTAVLSMANGLQGSLIGLRASVEGFSNLSIGLMMSFYYAGFLAGAHYTSRFVRKVGHPRVFAAMASMSSITILFHYLFVSPELWVVIRVVNGFCFAGLFVVAESWLNNLARNRVRGQIIAFYMMTQYLCLAAGYSFISLAPSTDVSLYLLVSILVSCALVPVLLSTGKTPRFEGLKSLSIKDLYRDAPLGAIGAVGMGFVQSISLTMGVVYCQQIGMGIKETTLFLVLFIISGALMQWPVGKISDKFDRRLMIAIWSLLATVTILAVQWGSGVSTEMTLIMIVLYGASGLCIYPMVVAHVNDRLKPDQMIGGSSTIFILYGGAASVGPFLCASMMDVMGASGFTVSLGGLHLMLGVYTIYRIFVRKAVPTRDQADFVLTAVPRGVSPLLKGMVKMASHAKRIAKKKDKGANKAKNTKNA